MKKLTIKYKKETDMWLQHEDIFMNDIYVGYIIKDTPLVGAKNKWYFCPELGNNLKSMSSQTREELLNQINN